MKSSITRGILLGLGSELAVVLLLWAALAILGIAPSEHVGWFGACLVPPLLLLRRIVRKGDDMLLVKTLITVLFVTTIVFLFFFLRTQHNL